MQGVESSGITWFRKTSSSSPLPSTVVITLSRAWPSCGLLYLSLNMNVQWYSHKNESAVTRYWPLSFMKWEMKKMRIIASWDKLWLSASITNTLSDVQCFVCPEMWGNGFLNKINLHRGHLLEFNSLLFIFGNSHNGLKCSKVMLLGETAYCFRVNYDQFC